MDQSAWGSATNEMKQDLSPLFNKDTICNFDFELKHRFEWWMKIRKLNRKWILISFGIFCLVGIIISFIQFGYANSNTFVCAGMITMSVGWLLAFCYWVILRNWFNKNGHDYYDIFAFAKKEGYLCDDLSQYPPVISITYYLNEAVTRPTKGGSWAIYQYFSPVFALSSLLTQIKDYQAKYCHVPNHDISQTK